jgi:DNA topoisomerase-1
VLAAQALARLARFKSQTEAKRNVARAIACVADRLGNTKAVCRKAYIHPAVVAAYMDGRPMATDEAGVAAMLDRRPRRPHYV